MQAGKASVLQLLKTARGQLDGIIRMVEEDRYCIDISNQMLATQSILKKVNREIMSAHMANCVQEAFAQGSGEEKMQEILALMDKMY
ncbi:MAG: metal-sensing transcriptional repressor [Christensenellales bacterium]